MDRYASVYFFIGMSVALIIVSTLFVIDRLLVSKGDEGGNDVE